MGLRYLSKSDFKVARECPTKLFYRKNKYPNTKEDDEFLQLLAEGGFMVGKMAQLYFPEGIEVPGGRDQEAAIASTKEYLKQDNIILFEPAIYFEGMLIRADILIKRGRNFELIEVKASSIDGSSLEEHPSGGTSDFWNKRGKGIHSDWRPYLEDVAYQTYVLQRALPESTIKPFLMLCDKSRTTTVDKLLQQFILHEVEDEKGNKTYPVEFTGDAEALRQDQLLIKIDVTPEVEYLLSQVKQAAEEYVASFINGYQKIQGPLTSACKNCEYRLPLQSTEKNGFLECWGEKGRVTPHLLDLRKLGNLKSNKEKIADSLFLKGKASLYDIPMEFLSSPKIGEWQKRQIEYTRKGEEWISPDLKLKLSGFKYPLHFIDFETARMALSYHRGMRPYGQVAFQWSCHTIKSPGAPPRHRDWINMNDTFPNIEFSRTLMECLGRDGTIFMWSHHEKSVLKDIASHIKDANLALPELADWLQWMNEHLVDQCKIAEHYYYHPDMKGSVSIKSVLPAIWNHNPYLHEIEYFKPYVKKSNGQVMNPYKTLDKIEINEEAEVIEEGTGAIRAYEEMMYGLHRGDLETHRKWRELLRQYCELDTMAMVIVYGYWCGRVGMFF